MAERTTAKLFKCLITIGDMITLDDLIESSGRIVALIVHLMDHTTSGHLATVPPSRLSWLRLNLSIKRADELISMTAETGILASQYIA